MPAETTIRVTDASGIFLFETASFLEIGNSPGLHYVLSCGQIGALTATLAPEFNSLLPKDGRIHVMRSVNGGPQQREGESCFLIRRWDFADDYTTVTAVHANDLMRRRHHLYSANNTSTQALLFITAIPADNAIKYLWRTNNADLIVDAERAVNDETSGFASTQQDIRAYVSTQANLSAAPAISKAPTWRNVMDLILEIEDASYLLGTYLTAEIVAPTETTLELRTYTVIRGTDRRYSTGNGLLFTTSRGNLENAILTVDAIEEITMVQAIGADNGGGTIYRFGGAYEDDDRTAESVLARVETVYDSGDAPMDGTLSADATAAVRAGRPVITATGDLVETDQCIRGIHFNYGDLVTVQVQGIQYDMRLDQLEVTLSGGTERTVAKFQYNG